MKKIVLAFDSFKGSVGSFEIAKAAEKAIQEELPDCQIIRFPIADGGEGTTEALCSALHAQTVSCQVHDPFMKPIEVSYGIVNNGAMAIIEMASACGLPLIDLSNLVMSLLAGTVFAPAFFVEKESSSTFCSNLSTVP